jgi:acyl-coenzyme A thioesterase PaaI-like protein
MKNLKHTLFVRAFGLMKVPMILFVSPTVVKMDLDSCVIKIPLNVRTRNHLKSMYFGSLCTGADIAGGLMAMNEISNSKKNIALSFKDFKAEFLKRAEGDVHFTCTQTREIKDFVEKVIESKDRMNFPVKILATVPSINPEEVVAKFELTLSLKLKD